MSIKEEIKYLKWPALIFIDFTKAYDSLDRGLLL